MIAAFCCASLGIVPTVRHADYIGSWLEVLREDNRAIVRAAAQASKAADYLLGFLPDGRPAPAAGCRVEGDGGRMTLGLLAPIRLCALPLFRLYGSAARSRGRGLRGFRDGLEAEREALGPPVAETIPMATAVQKITLSSSRDIPFNKLVLSQSNVRRVKAGVSIEELAEDIARRTLLQSLSVRPVLDAEGSRDRHVRDPGRRPPLPGARTAGEAEAPRQDRARALRGARSGDRHPRRGRLARREYPACAAPSPRPVPRLPGPAREGPVRGGRSPRPFSFR